MRNTIILLVIAICVWTAYMFISFAGLFDGDAMEYAEIGRSILQGKGFYADSLYTLRLPFSHTAPFPSLRRLPFLPLLMAGSFLLFGISDFSAIIVTGIFYVLTAIVIYKLALKVFQRKDIAILSSVLYIFNCNAIYYSIDALTEPIFAFLFTLAILCVYKASLKKHIFFGGLALGLAQLTRPNALLFIAPFLIYILVASERRKKILNGAVFMAAFILPSLYMLYYNYVHVGTPLFSLFKYLLLENTVSYPGQAVQRLWEAPDVFAYVMANPKEYLMRDFKYLLHQYHKFYQLLGPLLTTFFVVSILRWHSDRDIGRLRLLFYPMLLIQVLFNSLVVGSIRYYFHFIPIMLILTSEQIYYCMDNLGPLFKRIRYSKAVMLVVIFIIATFPFQIQSMRAAKAKFVTGKHPMAFIPDHPIGAYPKTGEMVKKWTKPGDILFTDVGFAVAWYGERTGLRIPLFFKDIKTIEEKYNINTSALLLTTDVLHWYTEDLSTWKGFLEGRMRPSGYALVERLELPGYKAVLYKKK